MKAAPNDPAPFYGQTGPDDLIKSTLADFADHLAIPVRKGIDRRAFTPNRIKIEMLSGLTVALALVPEAVAFAFVAGVHPLVGLYAAFIVGLITAVFGGRPGMISGATGALAIVMVSLVATHGVEYLFATVVLMGVIQVLAGAFHLGKFIRLVPHPVMMASSTASPSLSSSPSSPSFRSRVPRVPKPG